MVAQGTHQSPNSQILVVKRSDTLQDLHVVLYVPHFRRESLA
jgi:hypothetical protein